MKVPARYLTNYIGDLLVTDAGEIGGTPALFVLHWDSASTNFAVRRFKYIGPPRLIRIGARHVCTNRSSRGMNHENQQN